MRRKDPKYYSIDGKRRPSSRYLYLGEQYKVAATWNINDIKYIAVFNNVAQCYEFQRANAMALLGMFINIEYKHVSRPKSMKPIIDFITGKPAIDYFTCLPDDMYSARIKRRQELGLNKKKAISGLKSQKSKLIEQKYSCDTNEDRIACDIEIKNIERSISEIEKEKIVVNEFELNRVIPVVPDDDKYNDTTDERIASLESKTNRTANEEEELARLIDISNKYWDE